MARRPIGSFSTIAGGMFLLLGCNNAESPANNSEPKQSIPSNATTATTATTVAAGPGTPFHAQSEYLNIPGGSGAHFVTVFYALPDGSVRACRWTGPDLGQETIPLGCVVHSRQQ
jgi:hypothetical protein